MRLRWGIAVALVATTVAAPQGAALSRGAADVPGVSAAGRRPLAGAEPGFWARLVGPDGRADVSRAWRESARAVATAAQPIARVEVAAGQASTTSTDVGPAGDFDGDGGADVAVLRMTYRTKAVWVLDHVDVEARSGRTGRRLWTKRVTLPKPACEQPQCGHLMSFGYAFATPVGGAPGIAIVLVGQIADATVVRDPVLGFPHMVPGSSYLQTFDSITLDRRGEQRWARHLEGRIRPAGAVTRIETLPVVHSVSAGLEPGADLDWLYESYDGVIRTGDEGVTVTGQQVPNPRVDLTKAQTYALDGRTGADRAIGAARDGAYDPRDQTLVPDLSGDGRDDVVTTPPWTFYETQPGTVQAYRSSDRAALWQRPASAANVTFVDHVGDFTGDRRTELVLVPLVFESETARFTLLDGATGQALWTRSASGGAVVAGRRPLILLATSERAGATSVVTVTARDRRNRAAYTRRYTVRGSNARRTTGAYFRGLGDLDGDRADDFTVSAVITTRTETENVVSVRQSSLPLGGISGSTGRALPRYGDDTYALHESVDGRGDDVETDGRTGARIRDGRTGRTLLVIDLGQPITGIVIGTRRADGDRCPDVFVAAYPKGSEATVYGVVSGATGRLMWQATEGARTTARIRTSGRAYRCR